MANSPTFYRDAAVVATRAGEVPNANFDDGMNLGASNAPGVGIATDQPDLTGDPQGWTLNDQFGNPRTPQNSQHLGVAATAIDVATNGPGDGTATIDGDAHLTDLATGWSAV